MKKVMTLLAACALLVGCGQKGNTVQSPDGKMKVEFALTAEGVPQYSVVKNGKTVLNPSVIGLQVVRGCEQNCCGGEALDLTRGFEFVSSTTGSHDETWETTWGEEQYIRDHHNEMVVSLKHESGVKMDVVFRAFNDGFAFRYEIPEQENIGAFCVKDEATSYAFAQEPNAWSIPWNTSFYEGLWDCAALNEKDTMCSPITLEWGEKGKKCYGFLHEAALVDYPAENFYVENGVVKTFLTPWREDGHFIDTKAYCKAPFVSPWRMLILTENLPDMVGSRIMLNLNEPCKIEDTSFIRPMKFLGIWWGMHLHTWTWRIGPDHGATTEHMKEYLQFAADHNIQAVLAEGWNRGWEGYEGVNPGERFSFVKTYADWDQAELQRFAEERGVEIVCHHETSGNADQYEAEMDDAYCYMKKYGMTAVKTGYVSQVLSTVDGYQWNKSQAGVRHYRRVIEKAAKYGITIDNHEPVMPTGLQRTYPNLMTQEGIRGQEWNAWSADGGSPCEHVTVLPYTRFMAGPSDYTPGVFNFYNPVIPGTRVHSTLMNQLGLFVCLYSPLQMACDLPENYMRYPEAFRFIELVPCDWKKSVLLSGEIGDYCVFARQDRNSDNWYVGGITDEEAREVTVDWSFLEAGKTYTATLWRDGADADWESNPYAYEVETMEVTRESAPLAVRMATGGGFAIAIEVK